MKIYSAEELINQLEQQTEDILSKAIQQWQMINPAIIKQQPTPGSWSAMQCLGHLNAYGNYYLPAIAKAIDRARLNRESLSPTFTPGWLGNYFTRLMMPGENGIPLKKLKAPKGYTISNEGDSDAVIATFLEQQEKLLLLLHQARRINLAKIRIPISIATYIRLKLGDVFMFLIAHNIRHIKQAERAIAAAKVLLQNGETLQSVA